MYVRMNFSCSVVGVIGQDAMLGFILPFLLLNLYVPRSTYICILYKYIRNMAVNF